MSPDDASDANASAPAAGEAQAEEAPDSVFGNLPRTRPGARSPRRDAGAAKPRREPAAKADTPPAEPDQPAEPAAPPADEPGGGIEDVAWAGVAAAAEAATIGVRLATRALEAMRDAVDRR